MDTKSTKQMQTWSSDFGREYTDRNPHTAQEMDDLYKVDFGVLRSQLNKEFVGDLDRNGKILEVGANVGAQLAALKELGFKNLYGIELQPYAVEQSRKFNPSLNIIQGSAFDIPFKTGYFDLVYTSGVLIHIGPQELPTALAEIHRCSKKYIWGFEYYAEKYSEIAYRGNTGLLWKGDFQGIYLNQFKDLKSIKYRDCPYLTAPENVDRMYLMEKRT
jgi:pseudaminic acid biosynthesis-associated methylase